MLLSKATNRENSSLVSQIKGNELNNSLCAHNLTGKWREKQGGDALLALQPEMYLS